MDFSRIQKIETDQRYITTMRPVFNRRALFSDTTKEYVTPAEPSAYDIVTIKFRAGKNNIDRVFFVHKGQKHLMSKVESDENFDFYF